MWGDQILRRIGILFGSSQVGLWRRRPPEDVILSFEPTSKLDIREKDGGI